MIALGLLMMIMFQHASLALISIFVIGLGLSAWAIILSRFLKTVPENFSGRLLSIINGFCGLWIVVLYMMMVFFNNYVNINIVYGTLIVICLIGAFVSYYLKFSGKATNQPQSA